MIVVLNGYPGVGKLTIGQELAGLLSGKLLDIHTIYNLAFSMTEFKSPAFYDTIEKIEAIAHDLVQKLPQQTPVVLTTVLAGDSDWADQEWRRIEELGRIRGPLCVVHLDCELNENIRRIQSSGRGAKRKPQDPEMVRRNHSDGKRLHGIDALNLLKLDVTDLPAHEAARIIADWTRQIPA